MTRYTAEQVKAWPLGTIVTFRVEGVYPAPGEPDYNLYEIVKVVAPERHPGLDWAASPYYQRVGGYGPEPLWRSKYVADYLSNPDWTDQTVVFPNNLIQSLDNYSPER
jgi:hypothetical protein